MPKIDPEIRKRLDPQLIKFHDLIQGDEQPSLSELGVEAAREMYKTTLTIDAEEETTDIKQFSAPSRDGKYQIPIKLWTPNNISMPADGWPLLVHYHGGGWVIGGIYTEENHMSVWANAAQCAVATVDYRLAPEYKYPVAHEDSLDAYKYMVDNAEKFNINKKSIAVGGSSAGGNISASVCHSCVAENLQMPVLQVLIVASLDCRADSTHMDLELANAYGLNADLMSWFINHYQPDSEKRGDPILSPLANSDDSFSKQPPAVFIVGEVDFLRNDSREYAKKLETNGAEIAYYHEYKGGSHLFMAFSGALDQGKQAVDDVSKCLLKAFYPNSSKL